MNEKMKFNVRDLGYCCIFACLMANQREKEVVLAAELRVNPRTIRDWRKRLRDGRITCEKATPCLWPRSFPLPVHTAPDDFSEQS